MVKSDGTISVNKKGVRSFNEKMVEPKKINNKLTVKYYICL